jgi:putative PIN family toxin of toxin-antitoxin system
MTTFEIELTDETAKAAREAGLLTPPFLERLLQEALARRDRPEAGRRHGTDGRNTRIPRLSRRHSRPRIGRIQSRTHKPIVLDTSCIVSAAMRAGVPRSAGLAACASETVAMSTVEWDEIRAGAHRPGLGRRIDAKDRHGLLDMLPRVATWFVPTEAVQDCRDPKDDKFLERASGSDAWAIVTGDKNLLVPHPWCWIEILRPAEYLAGVTSAPRYGALLSLSAGRSSTRRAPDLPTKIIQHNRRTKIHA